MAQHYDVAVIGGGFYGGFIAYQVKHHHPRLSVVLLEREAALFTQASATNQGQFHRGYIYSQDPQLAAECAHNAQLFEEHFPEAIDWRVASYYGIHRESPVTPDSYEAFCASLELPLIRVHIPESILSSQSIAAAYETTERTFSSGQLGKLIQQRLDWNDIEIHTSRTVERVEPMRHDLCQLWLGVGDEIQVQSVINTAFVGINELHRRSGLPLVPTRYDLFAHFVIDLPVFLKNTAIVVIQGDYAIIMPSFSRSHVFASAAYRRLASSFDDPPTATVTRQALLDRFAQAQESCGEYAPVLRSAVYRAHTLGTRAAFRGPEVRPYSSRVMFWENFAGFRNYHVLMGGKVSCLFQAVNSVLDALAL
jgi:hypothetical protein